MKEKKALLLAAIAALCVLCGCDSKKNTIETEDGTYIEQNGEYVRLNLEPKTFEEGKHILQYVYDDGSNISRSDLSNGYNFLLETPEVPEGYKLVGVTSASTNDGYDRYIVYVFVNEVPVIVEATYDANTNQILYNTPGKIVEEQKLELGN